MIKVAKDFENIPKSLINNSAKNMLNEYINGEKMPRALSRRYSSGEVKETLLQLYHNKCAYCEQKLNKGHIAHYRPRNQYRFLTLEWSNLLPVCDVCSKNLGREFVITGEKFDNFSIEKISENQANYPTLLEEKALLIHPELYPENTNGSIKSISYHFKYLENGYIIGLTQEGVHTIDKLQLNRADLVERRNEVISKYHENIELKAKFISNFLITKDPEFTTSALKGNLFPILKTIKDGKKSDNEFAGMTRYIWNNFEAFFESKFKPEFWEVIKQAFHLFISKDDKLANKTSFKKINVTNGFLKKIQIENYFSLEDILLENLYPTKEIYFLGENGDGKTLILQAILIAVKRHYIEKIADKSNVGQILQYIDENKKLKLDFLIAELENNKNEKNVYLENIYAYGTNRNQSSSKEDEAFDKEGFLTLFYNDTYKLLNPISWLKDVKLEEGRSPLTIDIAKNLLEDLLDGNVKIELDGSEVKFTDIRFTERETQGLKFEQLSDGYKSIMTWVVDLVARLAKKQPAITRLQDYKGIVLVDEIGLHLHPKWEAKLVARLRYWFENIQFFFTTHSPVLVLNASKDAVFYRLYKEDGVSKISEKFHCQDFSDLRLNSLATSHLFGLDSSEMRSNEGNGIDTAADYRMNRIRKLVDEEILQLKESGKVYIPPFMLNNIVKKSINQNKK
jgi:uncharacterized protein (TIGR02646 family)